MEKECQKENDRGTMNNNKWYIVEDNLTEGFIKTALMRYEDGSSVYYGTLKFNHYMLKRHKLL